MITENDVLKVMVEVKESDNKVDYKKVMEKMGISDIDLTNYLRVLKGKGYITQTLDIIEITSLGMSKYSDL